MVRFPVRKSRPAATVAQPSIASHRHRQELYLQRKLDLLRSPKELEATAPVLGRARRLWKSLPVPGSVRGAATSLFYRLAGRARVYVEVERQVRSARTILPADPSLIRPGEFVLSGFLSDQSGIGRAGRMSVDVLRAAGLSPRAHDFRLHPDGWSPEHEGGVWLAHCNAPEAADFIFRSENPRNSYRIGYWAWELPELPPQWAQIAKLFHEIWAPSRFIADALTQATADMGIPIKVALHPHPNLSDVRPDRRRFGIPDGVFAFLCMYDVHSSATRKNPMGAVQAFQAAFEPDRKDALLIVKVVAAGDSKGCLDDLRRAVAGWPNIRIMTEMLTDGVANSLIASADAYVSLHRSEGFGLSIAQAMALGRPVIVTAWSGNMDFCDQGALLIPAKLIPVVDPTGVYDETGQVWADPDIAEAAKAMKRLADDPQAGQALGEVARRHLRERLPTGYELDHLRPWLA